MSFFRIPPFEIYTLLNIKGINYVMKGEGCFVILEIRLWGAAITRLGTTDLSEVL